MWFQNILRFILIINPIPYHNNYSTLNYSPFTLQGGILFYVIEEIKFRSIIIAILHTNLTYCCIPQLKKFASSAIFPATFTVCIVR